MQLSTIHRSIARAALRSEARAKAGRWDGKSDPAGNASIAIQPHLAGFVSDVRAIVDNSFLNGPNAGKPLGLKGWDSVDTSVNTEADSEQAKRDRKNAQARARRAAAKAAANASL